MSAWERMEGMDAEEAIVFTEALRRGVDPMFLISMYRHTQAQNVQSWAEEASMLVRDALPEYPGNPFTSRVRPERPMRLGYSEAFIAWFATRWIEGFGMKASWPAEVLRSYWRAADEADGKTDG